MPATPLSIFQKLVRGTSALLLSGMLDVSAAVVSDLPDVARPLQYDLTITPDADARTFQGQTRIEIQLLAEASTLTLHALDLTLHHASIRPASKPATVYEATTIVSHETQTVRLDFGKKLTKGRYSLNIDYSGKIGTQAAGLFAIDYVTASGKKRALFTQFENSDARRFMPCWDEPQFKATFALTTVVPAELAVISNMPARPSEMLANGLKRVQFPATPKMSTYLLFLGVGDFEREAVRVGPTEVGVVTRKGAIQEARFVLDSSAALLREYNDYFGVPFPLPKLDNVASPGRSQFFGAMENWGAIFSFEHALLLNTNISTPRDQQRVFSIAAHEMAHQWFGNLVTMKWWDDLWLNEGFASWMESRTTAKLKPEWQTALRAIGARNDAMNQDSLATTHPVVVPIKTVDQASQAFDAITYAKGKAVIGMLEHYVGADAWRDGVRAYMKKHAFGNTVSDDFWKAVEKATGKPVKAIAHDFTLQPGVPLIRVENVHCEKGYTQVQLKQAEFSRDNPNKTPLRWRVPVIVQVLGQKKPQNLLVSKGEATLRLPGCGPVVVNAGQSGYFRTLYTPDQVSTLAAQFSQLPVIDQLGLLSDVDALGKSGQQPVTDAFELVRQISPTAAPEVWEMVTNLLTRYNNLYDANDQNAAALRHFGIARLKPVLNKLGWQKQPGEASNVTILRGRLIHALSELEDEDTVKEARRLFDEDRKGQSKLPVELRKTILNVVAWHADADTWDYLHKMAQGEVTPLIRDEWFSLLAASRDIQLVRRALDLALTDEPGVTSGADMLARAAQNHPELVFDFALNHKQAIDALATGPAQSRFIASLAGQSFRRETADKVRSFAENHLAPEARRVSDAIAAAILDRARQRDQRLPQVEAWLMQKQRAL